MARGMMARHLVGEDMVEFHFHPCVAHSKGEFSGNFDVLLQTTPQVKKDLVVDKLRMKVPGDQKLMCVLGSRPTSRGVELTFHSEASKAGDPVPSKVDLYWGTDGDTYLGTLVCELAPDEVEIPEQLSPNGQKKTGGCLGFLLGLGSALAALSGLAVWLVLG